MNLRVEIEAFRSKISTAREEERQQRLTQNPRPRELPMGFYNSEQLVRYRRADNLVTSTVEEFMKEAGIEGCSMRREFITDRLLWRVIKSMTYILSFGGVEREALYGFESYDPRDSWARLEYEVGDCPSKEKLYIDRISLVIPKDNKRKAHQMNTIEASEAVAYFRDKNDSSFISASVQARVSPQGIRDMLTIIVSNPRLPVSAISLAEFSIS